jgi:hypothetical protein
MHPGERAQMLALHRRSVVVPPTVREVFAWVDSDAHLEKSAVLRMAALFWLLRVGLHWPATELLHHELRATGIDRHGYLIGSRTGLGGHVSASNDSGFAGDFTEYFESFTQRLAEVMRETANELGRLRKDEAAAVARATTTAVLPPPPSLRFTRQPSAAVVAEAFAPAPQVSAVDAQGVVVTTFTGPITLTLATNPGAAVLEGTSTVAAVAGVATFETLTIGQVGTGYQLVAASTGLTSATSNAFMMSAGPPANLVLVGGGGQTAGVSTTLAQPIVVRVTDARGNPLATRPVAFSTDADAGSDHAVRHLGRDSSRVRHRGSRRRHPDRDRESRRLAGVGERRLVLGDWPTRLRVDGQGKAEARPEQSHREGPRRNVPAREAPPFE